MAHIRTKSRHAHGHVLPRQACSHHVRSKRKSKRIGTSRKGALGVDPGYKTITRKDGTTYRAKRIIPAQQCATLSR